MSAQDQVIWTGEFRLDEALNQFYVFAEKVQAKMGNLSKSLSSGNSGASDTTDRVNSLLRTYADGAEKAEVKFEKFKVTVNQALGKGLIDPVRANAILQSLDNKLVSLADRVQKVNYKLEENINWTKGDVLALRSVIASLDNFDAKLQQADRSLALTNIRIKEQDKAFKEFFYRIVVGGFALQQMGMLMTNTVTRPMIEMGKTVFNAGLEFEQFEKRLEIVAGKSKTQIASIYDTVRKVAKEPNITLTETMQLFNNLLTIGKDRNLTDAQLETFGKGYTRALEAVTSTEKKSVLDFITDVFSTGEFGANVEKTLQLAPRLNKAMRDVLGGSVNQVTLQKSGLDAFQVLMKSMENLANQPAADSIQNKIDNITDSFVIMGKRIFDIYKNDLTKILSWIENNLLPVLDEVLNSFTKAESTVRYFIAAIVTLTAAAGPLIYIFGTLGVVSGGLAFIFKAASAGIAALTGNTVLAAVATSNLASLLASVGGSGGLLSSIVSYLPKILSFLTPLSIALGAIGSILIAAFSENAGGFKDAIAYFAGSVGQTLWNLLKGVYETLSAIGSIIGSIFDFLDLIGVTTAIGLIGSGIAYILGTVISLLNLLSIIPITLRFIADLLSGNFDLAFERANLGLLKMLKSLGVIGDIIGFFFGDLTEAIKKSEAEVNRLDKSSQSMNKNAQEDGEETKKQQDQVTEAYKKNQKAIDFITQAIQKQTVAIDTQILKNRQAAQERQNQLDAYLASLRGKRYSDAVESADLSTSEGRYAAQGKLAGEIASDTIEANRVRNTRIQKNLREYLTKQREEVLGYIKSETDASGGELYADSKKIYAEYAEILRQAIIGQEDITEQGASDLIFDRMKARILKSMAGVDTIKGTLVPRAAAINQEQFNLLSEYFANEKIALSQINKAELDNHTELLDAHIASRGKQEALSTKIREAEEEEERTRKTTPLNTKLSRTEYDIEQTKNNKSAYIQLGKEVVNLTTFVGQVNEYEKKLLTLEDERAATQKQIAIINYKNAADYDSVVSKIDEETKQRKESIQDDTRKSTGELFNSIIKDEIQQREELRGLLSTLQGYLQDGISFGVEYAKAGLSVDAEAVAKDVERYNHNLDVIFNLTTEGTFAKLKRLSLLAVPLLSGVAGGIAEPLRKAIGGLLEVDQKSLLDPAVRVRMNSQAEDVVKIIQNYINTANGLTPEGKAQLQTFIDTYVEFIQTLASGKEVLDGKMSSNIETLKVSQAEIEHQQSILEIQEKQLDLKKETLSLKNDRGILPDINNVSDFGKAIVQAITGGQQAVYKLEKQALENQKLRAENELKLALLRLKIEQEIFVVRARAEGVNEDKIKELQTQWELEREEMVKQGKLEQDLLNEKIRGLNKYGTTVTEIFTNVLGEAVGNIFSKKKKNNSDVKMAPNSNMGIPEGGIDTTLDDGMVSDKSVDKTGENVDETLSWLDKLQGGLGATKDVIFALGGALENLNDLSLKGIARALKEELKALGKKATVKALEYAAIAISAAVFGDWSTAGKAALAAASWSTVAVAAYAGAGILGTVDGDSAKNSASAQSTAAGYDYKKDYDASRDNQLLKQKLLSVMIQLDIRTDNGQIIKVNQTEINRNTALTTLVANSAGDWLTQPGI